MTAIDLIRPVKQTDRFWHNALKWLNPKPSAATGPLPRDDRFARDAGVTSTQQALLELQWPSQTTRHPML
ncbi:hypothetical protein TRM7615_03576 [Falsiruegeria mediterranea M17]|uniref:Uncharacterized protein n=1 Tax=Falsiruegeria mediterranea M17 TaxID=1200281 RepID=A0A2R8CCE5_9RHOB|nr:hypothetical protein TRM7615_03576 [Falsiruegeria mediterranea M17]